MSSAVLLSFTEDISVDAPASELRVIQTIARRFTLKGVTPGLAHAIGVLSSQGATEDDLARQVAEIDGDSSVALLYYYLAIFTERKMIRFGITCQGQPLATLSPIY